MGRVGEAEGEQIFQDGSGNPGEMPMGKDLKR
jgi:hypothetical protein